MLAISACASEAIEPVPGQELPVRSFILLRHAEKETGVPNPGLTPGGRARAEFLANHWGHPALGVRSVWSSDYRRTRDTAGPLAKRLAIQVKAYDAGDLEGLVKHLYQTQGNAVVIGHSNTTPKLAAMLCQCDIPPMDETDYETGYSIVVGDGQLVWSVLDLTKLWTDRSAPAD